MEPKDGSQELALEPAGKKGVCCYYGRDTLDQVKSKLAS